MKFAVYEPMNPLLVVLIKCNGKSFSWLILVPRFFWKSVKCLGNAPLKSYALISLKIKQKLENVFIKHYAPNQMPDPKQEWSVLQYIYRNVDWSIDIP